MRKPTEQDLKLCPDNVREAYLAMVKECKAWRGEDVPARLRLRPIRTVGTVARELGMNRHSVNKAERKALWKLFDGIQKLAEEDPKMRELLVEMGLAEAPSTTGREFAFDVRNRTAVARELRARITGGRLRDANRVAGEEVE